MPSDLRRAAVLLILPVVIGSLLLAGCGGSGPAEPETDPRMLYFYAEWWPVCKQMTPIVDGLEEKYGEVFNIVRVDIDTKEGKELAREHGFIGQPTFVFLDASGEEVRRLMGPQDARDLQQEIELLLKE